MNNQLTGSVTLPKLLLDRDILTSDPANYKSAFLDLWAFANDRERSLKIGGTEIRLKRGQLAYSQQTLAKLWRWDKDKVHRVLTAMQNEGLLTFDTSNRTTIITVLDYTIYNRDTAAEPEAETEAEPEAGSEAKPDAETEQKCEGGRRKKEDEEGAHARNAGFSGFCPEDAEVLEYASKFPGEPATGTPGPVAPDFAIGWLARMLGRQQFPPRWQRALIGDWRALWNKPERWQDRGATFAAAPSGNGGQKKNAGPMGATATRIALEVEAKKLRAAIESSPVRPDTDTDLNGYAPERLAALRSELKANKVKLVTVEQQLAGMVEATV
jgi:hypothetical protein